MQDETAPSAYPVGDASDFAALVDGRHGVPFAILGPHKRGRATWLTVFEPGAEEMAARIGERRHRLEPLFAYPGLFQGMIPGSRPYLLEGTRADGEGWRYEDPYRFGPVLGEMTGQAKGKSTILSLFSADPWGCRLTRWSRPRGCRGERRF